MPYEQELVERVRRTLSVYQERTERKMFGGLAFMLRGNMCCGVHGDELILRLNEELARQALTRRHVRRFDLGGRPVRSMVMVAAEGCRTDEEVEAWVRPAAEHALSLPAK